MKAGILAVDEMREPLELILESMNASGNRRR